MLDDSAERSFGGRHQEGISGELAFEQRPNSSLEQVAMS